LIAVFVEFPDFATHRLFAFRTLGIKGTFGREEGQKVEPDAFFLGNLTRFPGQIVR
jgi:hypothetical protein